MMSDRLLAMHPQAGTAKSGLHTLHDLDSIAKR
jgi:hypothetical protein